MKTACLIVLLAVSAGLPAAAQEKKPSPATAAKPAAGAKPLTINGTPVSALRLERMTAQRSQSGAPGDPNTAARQNLIALEVVAQEAVRRKLHKSPDVQAEMDQMRATILFNAFAQDFKKNNPVPDADLRKEYERAKAGSGDKEYNARHILVPTEEAAKEIITKLKGGAKFEELEKNSIDRGSAAKGGELGWSPATAFVKSFADALRSLNKGQLTETPVRSEFGFNVIWLDDVRALKFPPFDDIKSNLQDRMLADKMRKLISDLVAKAKVEGG